MDDLVKKRKKIEIPEAFLEAIALIPDERVKDGRLHSLKNIIIMGICTILCGADSFSAMERIGNCKKNWFKKFLWMPHGIPSHDTFRSVFIWLDPKALQNLLINWGSKFRELADEETVAIDGKTERRSFDRKSETPAIQVVSAFACKSNITLGAIKVRSKINEIKAIPQLLDMIDVEKCTVTVDALGSQQSVARKIREKGANYVLAVKKTKEACTNK